MRLFVFRRKNGHVGFAPAVRTVLDCKPDTHVIKITAALYGENL